MKIDKQYPLKALKFVFYFFLLFFILVSVAFLISKGSFIGYQAYMRLALTPNLAIALFCLGVAYPFFGFVKRSFFYMQEFSTFKPMMLDAFVLSGFVLESQEDNQYLFKSKSRLKRYLSMYEDGIEVVVLENSIVITGLRREVSKIMLKLHDFTRDNS